MDSDVFSLPIRTFHLVTMRRFFYIEFVAMIFYNPTDVGDLNSDIQGPAVVNVVRVRSFLHYLSQCFALAFFPAFFFLIGLIAVPGYAEPGTVKGKHLAGYPLKQKFNVNPADLPLETDCHPSTPLLAQLEYPAFDQDAPGGDEQPEKKSETVEPITRHLPIWGEKVREMGFDLPLPFGVGANLVFMDQGIDVRNLKIGFSAPNISVSRVSFSNTRAHDSAATARLDLWLLPVANIYGIFGYINGEAELDVSLAPISLGNIPITDAQTHKLDIDYKGTTYGGGITLAGGYKDFFGSLDANYTYSNIDVADSKIETYTISPRLGILVDPDAIEGSLAFWVGAMYMDYKQTVTDSIDLNTLSPGLPSVELNFEIDIKNDQPWNFLFGGQWEITKRWQFMAEGGIGDRKQFITGLFFRF